MSQFMIQEVTTEQLPQCAKVILEAFDKVGREFGFQHNEDLAPLKMRLDEYTNHNAVLYGAFLENIQIGFYLLDNEEQKFFEIGKLCILPSYQGKGYGQRLLSHALDRIGEINGIIALCAIIDENKRLKRWLEKNHFIEEFCGPLSGRGCSICLMKREVFKHKSSLCI